MTVSFLGCGYLGLTYSAVFAAAGHKVYAVETNKERLDLLKQGKSFFYEEGLEELISVGLDSCNLIPTDSYEQSVSQSDVVFSSVGTPDNPDGSPNLDYIFSAVSEAVKYLRPGSVYVQKSTVPVGVGRKIIDIFKNHNLDVSYLSSPEFLAEGTSIRDILFYDRLVIGGDNERAIEKLLKIHEQVDARRENIIKSSGIRTTHGASERIIVSIESAELIKASANSFLALKISFANSIAKLADASGADIVDVMNGIGTDRRIGRAFLSAGRGYGGGCFPKDVDGLIFSASSHGIDLDIMTAAQEVNESMPGYIANKARTIIGSLDNKKLAVLGLSFKAGTSDARRSPGVKLANILNKSGATVAVYDPHVVDDVKSDLRKGIIFKNSTLEAIKDADAIFIATEWREFLDADFREFAKLMSGKLVFDAVNALDIKSVERAGLIYTGVGRR